MNFPYSLIFFKRFYFVMLFCRIQAYQARHAVFFATTRGISTDQKEWFTEEAVSHARRVSWSPHTSVRRDGMIFAKLARSNFPQMEDKRVYSYEAEPYCAEEIEAHRDNYQPDVYLYKYSISPTHLRLRKP